MLDATLAAALQHVDEASEIGLSVDMGVIQRITHAGLCREVDDPLELVLAEQRLHGLAIGDVQLEEFEIGHYPQ
ncbi:hypothetical protein D9M70_329430 [compost metagenome]